MIILVFMGLDGYFCPVRETENKASCIEVVDSLRLSSEEKISRLHDLITIVLQHQSDYGQDQRARESERTQNRILFATLIAGLWAASLSLKEDHNRVISFAILALGLLVYLNDVRTIDSNNREQFQKGYLDNGIVQLANVSPQDYRFYKIDYAKIMDYERGTRPLRPSRLIHFFFKPDPTQILFYLAPMFIILIVRRFMKL